MYTNGISSVDPATSKSIEIANHGILIHNSAEPVPRREMADLSHL